MQVVFCLILSTIGHVTAGQGRQGAEGQSFLSMLSTCLILCGPIVTLCPFFFVMQVIVCLISLITKYFATGQGRQGAEGQWFLSMLSTCLIFCGSTVTLCPFFVVMQVIVCLISLITGCFATGQGRQGAEGRE